MKLILAISILSIGLVCCKGIVAKEVKTIMINLPTSYDSTFRKNDMRSIKKIDGVTEVTYISKEMAKEIYLADGNEEWNPIVLDHNPLPESFKVKFDVAVISPTDYGIFEKKIKTIIKGNPEIIFPK